MPTAKQAREARIAFWLGAVIVFVTSVCQAVILFDNASYTLGTFGWSFLIVYIAAAVSYVLMPWVEVYLADAPHLRLTRYALLAFCFWIGAEATLHSSHAYAAPEGLAEAASLFTSRDIAGTVSVLTAVALVLIEIEVLSRLHYQGADLVRKNYRHVRRK